MIRLNRLGLMARKVHLLALALCLFTPSLAASQVDVLTQHNDPGRTGQNLNETILTTSNVTVNNFGKLFGRAVDGQIYAQPLYVANLAIQGTTRNVVFVATMHNSVYAFDADDPNTTAPIWQVNLGTPVPSTDIDPAYRNIYPEIGILSTPVIDAATGTIYAVANTKDTANSTHHFFLHALNILTGAEKFGGPVEITGQVAGTGDGSSNGTVTFDPFYHLNRPGLLLMNGVVYLAFGSIGDVNPYHGWVFGYAADTLQPTAIYNDTPNGSQGAIWQAGQGLLGLAGNIYFMTGNGTFNADTGGTEYGDSFVKLSTSAGLTVADYFTPFDQATLNSLDMDLGAGGPMALPGTGLIVGIGKDGVLRLIDTANMGQFNAVSNHDVQEFQAYTGGGEFMGGPIYWNSPINGAVIYLWGSSDYLKSYRFSGSSFQITPVSQSSMTETPGYSNTVPLSLSANGSQAGTGIVWASAAYSQDASNSAVTGILRAFDATDLSVELWNSTLNAARDDVGNYAKFCPPTIANGKVYLPTFSGQLLVYGLTVHTVTPSSGPGGSISPAVPQSVNFNTTTSFTVTPSTGYQIASVTGCGGSLSGNTYTTGSITGDCTVSASFALNTYTVTPSAGTGGSISPAIPQTVSYNATTSFIVTPSTGYQIASVTGCGGSLSGNTYTTGAITGNCTVSASFGITHDGIVNPAAGKASPDIGDALKVFQYYLGATTLSDLQKAHADVAPLTGPNGSPLGNGVVDIADVITILRRVVGAVTW